ncbi:MAG: hypothetical protein JWQ86_4190 [Mycobacterium sp.]|jgi:hypothetical protein|nr:hypothetical protein [Mycobacterium sp.]
MKRAIIVPALVTAFVALSPVGVALADNPHSGPPAGSGGQPSKSEGDNPTLIPPGHNTAGFAHAALVYANPTSTGGLASGNSHVVSQYDVAGFQCSQHPNCPGPK